MPVGIAVIRKTRVSKCWRACEKRGPLRETAWGFLKKLEVELLYDSHFWEEMKTLCGYDICTLMFITALLLK